MPKPDWATRKSDKSTAGFFQPESYRAIAARLLRLEHRRAVRVVEKRDAWILNGGYDNMSADFQAGYHQACYDLLVALGKGR